MVGEAGSIAEALARVEQLRPDAALVDIGLPDGDGLGSAGSSVAAVAAAHRLDLTDARDHERAAVRRAGANGFLAKHELAGNTLRRLLEDG